MDRRPLRKVVGEEWRDHQLEEENPASMEQPQQPRHGEAAPRPLFRRLAEGGLQGQGIGPGTSRAINEKRAMAMLPPFVPCGPLHRAAATLEDTTDIQEMFEDTNIHETL